MKYLEIIKEKLKEIFIVNKLEGNQELVKQNLDMMLIYKILKIMKMLKKS